MQSVWSPPTIPVVENRDDDAPSPWLLVDVWLSPREVVRTVLDHGSGWYGVLPLLCAFGVAGMELEGTLPEEYWWVALFLVFLPIAGIVGASVEAALVWLSATVLGIATSFKELLVAGAWGRVPRITGGLLAAPVSVAVWLGAEGPVAEIAMFAVSGVGLLTWLWGAVVHMSALGEAMRVSTGRALFVYVAPWFFLFGIVLFFGLLAVGVGMMAGA